MVHDAHSLSKELILFKVDFEKAYDLLDWGYLEQVMIKMSFPTLWRKWVLECITMTSASVLVNGSPTDEFKFERGLSQGDPLSPFLFLLAVEGLNVLMNATVDAGLYIGFGIGIQGTISISHLQFVDDTLLVGNKSWADVRSLKVVLMLF